MMEYYVIFVRVDIWGMCVCICIYMGEVRKVICIILLIVFNVGWLDNW